MEQTQLISLVKQAQHGSAEAFGEIYGEYSRELYRFALWYLHNEADAEDAVQDACLSAYRNIKALRNTEMFRSWFFKILANVCRDKLKCAEKNDCNMSLEASEFLENTPSQNGESFIYESETAELVNTLPEPDRTIVIMSAIAGFRSNEIGKILRLNSSTVRSKLSRALAKLRAQLEEEQESVANE